MTGGFPLPVPVTEKVSVKHSVLKMALTAGGTARLLGCPATIVVTAATSVFGPEMTKLAKSSRSEQTFGLHLQIVATQAPALGAAPESKKVAFSLLVPPHPMVKMQQTPKLFAHVPVATPFLLEHSDAV